MITSVMVISPGEEKNGECAACLKYSVLIFVEKNI
jgi:hypothetical protein